MRAQNIKNRKHSLYGHTGGRKSAAMVEEEMMQKQEDPTIPILRHDVWVETHTKKDGTTLPSAAPFMEKVKAKVAEAKQSESNDSSVHPLSIDDDPLSQVFPKKLKSGLFGVGSYVTKSQYDASLPAHIMYSGKRVEKDVMAKKFERMEEKYERMEKKLDCLLDVFNKYTSQAQSAGGTSMSMIPMMSPTHGQSLNGKTRQLHAMNQLPQLSYVNCLIGRAIVLLLQRR